MAATVLVVSLVSCNDSADGTTPVETDPSVDPQVVQRSSAESPEDGLTAQVTGTVEMDDEGCLYLAGSGHRYPLVWPVGTTVDADGRIVVGDHEVAVGDGIVALGGFISPDDLDDLEEPTVSIPDDCQSGEELAVLSGTGDFTTTSGS
jgi:hypothetical protein